MATKKKKSIISALDSITELRKKYTTVRINIKAGKEKNTNAHKPIKKQIAHELTKITLNKQQ